MLIEGEWRETPTTVPRPYLRAHLAAHDGTWIEGLFLIDTGADCTVISSDITKQLGRPTAPALRQLGGIGGEIETLEVWTTLQLTGQDGNRMNISGAFATTSEDSLSESILGYDILQYFALIIDKRNNVVSLVNPPHGYTISRS